MYQEMLNSLGKLLLHSYVKEKIPKQSKTLEPYSPNGELNFKLYVLSPFKLLHSFPPFFFLPPSWILPLCLALPTQSSCLLQIYDSITHGSLPEINPHHLSSPHLSLMLNILLPASVNLLSWSGSG